MPGRVEFLGKHTDYAGGRSLVCATVQGMRVIAQERFDPVLRITDARIEITGTLHLGPDLMVPRGDWLAYPATVARRLARDFGPLKHGVNFSFASDLPQDAGLSSSSTFVVAVALALMDANQLQDRPQWREAIPNREALAGYLGAVENGRAFGAFTADGGVGTQGGSQDQTAILCSRPGMLVQYGWIPVRFERAVPFPKDHLLVVAVSGVEAAKTREAMALYNRLAEAATELLRVWRERSGRDDRSLFAALDSAPDARVRLTGWLEDHPERAGLSARLEQFWGECDQIIPGAAAALEQGDLSGLGLLVDRSQHGAERGLENQVPETIHLQRSARALGAVAASAFGAGFGGSVWAMVRESEAGEFMSRWRSGYKEAFPGPAERSHFMITGAAPPATEEFV